MGDLPLIGVLRTSARAGILALVETLCVSARVGDLPKNFGEGRWEAEELIY